LCQTVSGVDQIQTNEFDLVIIQNDLQDLSGLDMVQILRQLGSNLHVILLTSSQPDLQSHDDTYIVRLPFASKDLTQCISDILTF
jgi:DNA-binding response OmpR family regulator